MNFTKTAKSITDQILLLKSRGLIVEDDLIAAHHLNNISYYRLSAYLLSFQKYKDPNHTYMPWATFNRVVELYVFDRELRAIIMDAIERIEVAFRCRIVYEYCHAHGNNWYEDRNLFLREHSKFMNLVSDELKKSKETFISHYFRTYTNPKNPPSWMTIEILSFGQISTMYKNLANGSAKKAIANYFGVSPTILESWMEHLVYVRNICAHHNRLWNRIMTVKAKIPSIPSYRWITNLPSKPDKIYTTLCIIAYMSERVTTKSTFSGRIKTLLSRFPNIDIKASGFNEKWKEDPFWSKLYLPITHQMRMIYFNCKNYFKQKRMVS
jgi:abortive infection bacteriophage resistance protein